MSLNKTIKSTYHIFNKEGMIVVKDDDKSWRDSIGRNMLAYFIYGDEKLLDSIEECFVDWTICVPMKWEWPLKRFGKWIGLENYCLSGVQGYRDPRHIDMDMSRDHVVNALIAAKLGNRTEFIKRLKKLKWRLSHKHTMRGMYFWYKYVTGSKWALPLFYLCKYPETMFMVTLNKLLSKLGKFSEDQSQEYWEINKEWLQPNDKQKKLRKVMVPMYALETLAFQIYVLPDGRAKKALQRLLLKIVGKHNYATYMLLGYQPPHNHSISTYKSMNGWRWGVHLNETNDRDSHVLKDPKLTKYNDLERDYLNKLYNEII